MQHITCKSTREFTSGNSVVHRASRPFSPVGIDHAYEQATAAVSGDGGANDPVEFPYRFEKIDDSRP